MNLRCFLSPGLALVLALSAWPARADLLVSAFNGNSVLRYSENNGASLGTFIAAGSGGLSLPHGLATGPDGNLYVASAGNDSVLRYNPTNGAFIDAFVPSGSGGLDYPVTLIFRPDGLLYVSSQLNDRVLRFNASTGAFVDTFVTNASGGLDGPSGMAFAPDGKLIVVGRFGDHVLRYGADGAFVDAFVPAGGGGLAQPFGCAFGPDGHLLVTSGNSNKVARFHGTTGAYLGDFIATGSGTLSLPVGGAFGPDGRFYVASFNNDKIARYQGGSGAYTNDFVAGGSGGLDGPNFFLFRPAQTAATNIAGIGPVGPLSSATPRPHLHRRSGRRRERQRVLHRRSGVDHLPHGRQHRTALGLPDQQPRLQRADVRPVGPPDRLPARRAPHHRHRRADDEHQRRRQQSSARRRSLGRTTSWWIAPVACISAIQISAPARRARRRRCITYQALAGWSRRSSPTSRGPTACSCHVMRAKLFVVSSVASNLLHLSDHQPRRHRRAHDHGLAAHQRRPDHRHGRQPLSDAARPEQHPRAVAGEGTVCWERSGFPKRPPTAPSAART